MKNDKHVIQIENTVESNLSSPLILGIFYIYSSKMDRNRELHVTSKSKQLCTDCLY